MHNADDVILGPGDLGFLRKTFGAVIFAGLIGVTLLAWRLGVNSVLTFLEKRREMQMMPYTRIEGRDDGTSTGGPAEVTDEGVKGDEAGGVFGTTKSECSRRGMLGCTWRKNREICQTIHVASAPATPLRAIVREGTSTHELRDHVGRGDVCRLRAF